MATETTTIKVVADTSQAERALGSLSNTLKGLVTIGALTALTQQFIRISDEATNMQNKLGLVMQAGQTTSEMFNLMAKTANNLGAPLSDVGDLFFRIANNTKDLGLAQTDQLRVTELMTKAFMTTGLSMNEAKSAVVQFGQGLSAGVLRGEELNSVLENAPPIADAIARHFGVARGALKTMGEQGKITSKDVIAAMLAAGESIDKDFARRIPTIQNALNILSNSVGVLGKKLNEQTGANMAVSYAILILTDAIISVYDWFEKWGKVILFVVEAIAFIYVPLRIARTAFALLIGPIEWLFGLFRTGGGVIAGFGQVLTKLGEYITPITEAVGLTSFRFAQFFGILAAGASALGLGNLFAGISDLFSEDKTTAAEKYKKKLEEINKRLGIDTAKAATTATAATGGLTAEQLKNIETVRKANLDRTNSYKELLSDMQRTLTLAGYEGAEYDIQNKLLGINKDLHKAIKNDKGEIIGYTKGLTDAETKQLRTLIETSMVTEAMRDLKKSLTDSQLVLNSLALDDLDTREISLAVEKERAKLGPLFNKDMEDLITKNATNNQLVAQAVELEKQRALLSGTATPASKAQRIATVTAAIEDFSPGLKAAQEYETKRKAIDEAIYLNSIDRIEEDFSAYETILKAKKLLDENYEQTKKILQINAGAAEKSRAIQFQSEIYSAIEAAAQANATNIEVMAFQHEQRLRDIKYTAEINAATMRYADLEVLEFQHQEALKEIAIKAATDKHAMQLQMGTAENQFRKFSGDEAKAIAADRAAFEKKTELEKTGFAIDQGAQLFNALGTYNKDAFNAAKAFNIANAIMNTYMGATKALATYPPPFNFIAAAGVVAMGLAQVASIRSQQYSGRALGGPVMGNQPYLVGENGPELFTPATSGGITRNDQLGGGGTTNVTFNILANDTAGFDQLLTSRRGLITTIIADAQLERGRRS